MTSVKLAVPAPWTKEDERMIDLFFRGLIRRSKRGLLEDLEVEYAYTNDYGGVALIECTRDADRDIFNVAAGQMGDAMQMRDPNDPFAELRKMSEEDRKDRAKIKELLDAYFEQLDRK
jgi:hypothetical protein